MCAHITVFIYLQDSFPSPCGSESLYSTLSERDLTDDVSLFKYFALNNQTIVGVLDGQSPQGKLVYILLSVSLRLYCAMYCLLNRLLYCAIYCTLLCVLYYALYLLLDLLLLPCFFKYVF